MASKRKREVLNDDESPEKRKRPCLSPASEQPGPSTSLSTTLAYPSTAKSPQRPTPFQKPLPLLTFSYTSSRTLEFTDSALRFFVQPPPHAHLSHGYDRWIRRPEEKGRVDGLLTAWDRARRGSAGLRDVEVGVVAWRGVMTR